MTHERPRRPDVAAARRGRLPAAIRHAVDRVVAEELAARDPATPLRVSQATFNAATRRIAELENELDELRAAARHIDEILLRSFDAGMLDQAIEQGCCGIDTWGTLRDFRQAFGLPRTVSAEEWGRRWGQIYPPTGAPTGAEVDAGQRTPASLGGARRRGAVETEPKGGGTP